MRRELLRISCCTPTPGGRAASTCGRRPCSPPTHSLTPGLRPQGGVRCGRYRLAGEAAAGARCCVNTRLPGEAAGARIQGRRGGSGLLHRRRAREPRGHARHASNTCNFFTPSFLRLADRLGGPMLLVVAHAAVRSPAAPRRPRVGLRGLAVLPGGQVAQPWALHRLLAGATRPCDRAPATALAEESVPCVNTASRDHLRQPLVRPGEPRPPKSQQTSLQTSRRRLPGGCLQPAPRTAVQPLLVPCWLPRLVRP